MMTEMTPIADKAVGRTRRRYSLRRGERGQAALEFMLVLPIFISLFLLVVDLGVLMYHYVSVSNAVREGARYGSINCGDGSCTDDEIKDRTIARSGGILSSAPEHQNRVRVDWVDNENLDTNGIWYARGDSVVVRVNHPYEFLFFPGGKMVYSCADMRLEQTDRGAPADLPAGSEC